MFKLIDKKVFSILHYKICCFISIIETHIYVFPLGIHFERTYRYVFNGHIEIDIVEIGRN